MGMHRFLAVFKARNREFLRDRTALSWNIVLPVLIVMGFAFAFTKGNDALFKVAVLNTDGTRMESGNFLQTRHIRFIYIDYRKNAFQRVIYCG